MGRKNGMLAIWLCLAVALALTAGCARKSKAVQPAFAGDQGTAATAGMGREEAESRLGEGSMGGMEEGELPIPQTDLARDLVFQEASREVQTIYFEYDSAELKPEAKTNLDRAALWLKNLGTLCAYCHSVKTQGLLTLKKTRHRLGSLQITKDFVQDTLLCSRQYKR